MSLPDQRDGAASRRAASNHHADDNPLERRQRFVVVAFVIEHRLIARFCPLIVGQPFPDSCGTQTQLALHFRCHPSTAVARLMPNVTRSSTSSLLKAARRCLDRTPAPAAPFRRSVATRRRFDKGPRHRLEGPRRIGQLFFRQLRNSLQKRRTLWFALRHRRTHFEQLDQLAKVALLLGQRLERRSSAATACAGELMSRSTAARAATRTCCG